jgi:hypothetical protein
MRANDLLNVMLKKLHLKTDASLAKVMGVAPPVISKMRHGKLPVGASFLITAEERTGMSIRKMKEMLDQRSLPRHPSILGAAS